MRTAIASILIAGLVVILGGLAFLYSGFYDVGATAPHWAVTRWVLETARMRSIKVHAAGIEAPPGLDYPATILIGVEHFAAHCAVCHGGLLTSRMHPRTTPHRSCFGFSSTASR